MRVVSRTVVEDCVGHCALRYRLDRPLTRETILDFGRLGHLEIYAELAHPFFRVFGRHGLRVKGTEGEDNCLVVLPGVNADATQTAFERIIERAA